MPCADDYLYIWCCLSAQLYCLVGKSHTNKNLTCLMLIWTSHCFSWRGNLIHDCVDHQTIALVLPAPELQIHTTTACNIPWPSEKPQCPNFNSRARGRSRIWVSDLNHYPILPLFVNSTRIHSTEWISYLALTLEVSLHLTVTFTHWLNPVNSKS